MIVSQKLISTIKLDNRRAYQIAWAAGVNPTMLSKLLNGIERPKPNDARIIAVGEIVGIPPEECFQGGPTDKTVQECAGWNFKAINYRILESYKHDRHSTKTFKRR